MNNNDYTGQTIPCVIGLSKTEAMQRLLLAGAFVTCREYSSKKGVIDADDLRIIRQHNQVDGEKVMVELIVSPCRTHVLKAKEIK